MRKSGHPALRGDRVRRSADLLGDWEAAGARFTKVLPRDYARVLAARDQAESEGLDEAATDRMMERHMA